MSNLFALRGLVIAVAWMAFTATASSTPLPNPLTLEQALALADESHPDLDFARAELALVQARQLESGGHYATRAYLDISAETVDPSSGGGYLDDSRARLLVNRPIFDFGYTRASMKSCSSKPTQMEIPSTRLLPYIFS